ncbi:transmembrane channel-like protein 7 [Aricia agestis]|uniref:transmembrane channel-like protein 7 n=1 Tax=Aricia agestis TaxID=91739 RepID=UPI001C203E62|nr:transmembrane channel-like protein 7 [Aricia agestis]
MEDGVEDIELNPTQVRRTMTQMNNVARQIAVNFMPSRQLPHNTLRARRGADVDVDASSPDEERRADIIVREMEHHGHLMEDNPVAEELRREALRELPQGLTMKRSVRAKLSASVSLRSKRRPLSTWKRFKYRVGFAWKRFRGRCSAVLFSVELWYDDIRAVEGALGSAAGSYFRLLRQLFALDVLLGAALLLLLVLPQLLHDAAVGSTGDSLSAADFVSGKGGLESSVLFYGHYSAGEVAATGPSFSMPFAYFFTMLCLYMVTFAVLCYKTAAMYRQHFIESSSGGAVFAARVFCGWDFGIVAPHAAALAAHALYNEFKELLAEQTASRGRLTWCVRAARTLVNVVASGVALAVSAVLAYGVWRLLAAAGDRELLLSLAITAILAATPLLFHLVAKLEYYKARTAFYVTLARTWLLDITIFMILFVYWAQSGTKCWETSFGQEMYRLVVLDTLVSLLLLPAIDLIRGCIYKCRGWSGPDFNVSLHSLSLIYNQSVVWFGLAFAPPLALVLAVKLLLLFYVNRATALRMCHPAKKVWRAAQSQTLMLVLVTLSLFATLFAIGTMFLGSEPRCGPFTGYSAVYELVTQDVLRLSSRRVLRATLAAATRPAAIAALLLALCVAVYFVRAKSQAQRSMVALLRQMLVLQAQDKDFLLGAIEKVSKGEWLYSPRSETADDSHTWRYVHDVRRPSNAGFQLARPLSVHGGVRPVSGVQASVHADGDTDSSFSWQGSDTALHPHDQ